MFYLKQDKDSREQYERLLQIIGSLSNLFSDSKIPYLYYRIAEKVFCSSFLADDLSRSDLSADAKKDMLGIGLKTFLIGNNRSFQKIAEFNKAYPLYRSLSHKELINKIAELRNNRIDFTESTYNLTESCYHCVVRDAGVFKIFEEPMSRIDIDNIGIIKANRTSIIFEDGNYEYNFSLTKSTLQKRFCTDRTKYEFPVKILADPLKELKGLLAGSNIYADLSERQVQTVYLPLYSAREMSVQRKSGLNLWNASGRARHPDEVYISIPIIIHRLNPDFFPSRDFTFNLKFPDGEIVPASVCQENSKALMTNPNKKLGKLILRDGLKLEEGVLATYEGLQSLGIDSVRIDKTGELDFEINFAKCGSYETYIESFD